MGHAGPKPGPRLMQIRSHLDLKRRAPALSATSVASLAASLTAHGALFGWLVWSGFSGPGGPAVGGGRGGDGPLTVVVHARGSDGGARAGPAEANLPEALAPAATEPIVEPEPAPAPKPF